MTAIVLQYHCHLLLVMNRKRSRVSMTPASKHPISSKTIVDKFKHVLKYSYESFSFLNVKQHSFKITSLTICLCCASIRFTTLFIKTTCLCSHTCKNHTSTVAAVVYINEQFDVLLKDWALRERHGEHKDIQHRLRQYKLSNATSCYLHC